MALTRDDKTTIYVLIKIGFKQTDLATKYNVSPAYISKLAKKMADDEEFYKNIDKITEGAEERLNKKIEEIKRLLKGE